MNEARRYARRIWVGFGLATLLLATLSATALWALHQSAVTGELVVRSWQIIDQLYQLEVATAASAGDTRAYLAAGEPHYLDALQWDSEQARRALDYARYLTTDNPSGQKALAELGALLNERLALMLNLARNRKQHGTNADQMPLSMQGALFIGVIVRQATHARELEQTLLRERTARETRIRQIIKYLVLYGSSAGLLLLTFTGFYIKRTVGLLHQAMAEAVQTRHHLEDLNDNLARRVEERARDLTEAHREIEGFTYTISHDFRAPLRAVDGFSHVILNHYREQLPPQALECLEEIRTNARKMNRLLDDLLALSRIGRHQLNRRRVEPLAIAHEALEKLRGEQKAREVEVRSMQMPPCNCDPTLLREVYLHLLANAFHFTRDRERALIEMGWQDSYRDHPGPVYFVRDNGMGFDMQYSDRLFNVFERLYQDQEYDGTGAGLAIAQRIIERHGGRIWAEGEPGTGAAFYFTLGGEEGVEPRD